MSEWVVIYFVSMCITQGVMDPYCDTHEEKSFSSKDAAMEFVQGRGARHPHLYNEPDIRLFERREIHLEWETVRTEITIPARTETDVEWKAEVLGDE